MRRVLRTLSIALLAACARPAVDTRPVAPATATTPDAPAPPPQRNGLPPAQVFRAPTAQELSFDLRLARDSAADEAVLENLAEAAPKADLPDLPIDASGTRELSIQAFADQPRVLYYIDFFSNRMHERFQVWLNRMPRYEGYARERLVAQGLPGDLVYLALIESGFSSSAVSHAAAVGIWQFMPATGREYGLRVDGWVDERRDPIKATDAAARHLKNLNARFGSYYLAAAAYNAGAGKVGRSLNRMTTSLSDNDEPIDLSSDEAFFSLADTKLIVQETRDYVPKLIAAALIAKDPTSYGFGEAEATEPFSRDSVMVDGGTGLDLIARLADTTLDALRELNPHLLRLVTPPGARYAVRVPNDRAEVVTLGYAAVPESERLAIATHKVKRGETVATIAKHYGVSSEAIRGTNRAARGRQLKSGTTLYIPVSNTIPVALMREPAPIANSRATTRVHVVKRGETLGGIAQKYHVTVASLRSSNRLGKSNTIYVGQRLVVRRPTRA